MTQASIFPADVLHWLRHGERGNSSETIVGRLYNVPFVQRESHPRDPGDFVRCQKLLAECPSVRARFHEMRSVSPAWERLVAVWPAINVFVSAERWEDAALLMRATIGDAP